MTGHDTLTKDKLIDVLRHIHKTEDVSLLKTDIRPAAAKGDNMVGEVLKVDLQAAINGQEKVQHVPDIRTARS